jgi:hypothetical protein
MAPACVQKQTLPEWVSLSGRHAAALTLIPDAWFHLTTAQVLRHVPPADDHSATRASLREITDRLLVRSGIFTYLNTVQFL